MANGSMLTLPGWRKARNPQAQEISGKRKSRKSLRLTRSNAENRYPEALNACIMRKGLILDPNLTALLRQSESRKANARAMLTFIV
jgi:hypothetical protein